MIVISYLYLKISPKNPQNSISITNFCENKKLNYIHAAYFLVKVNESKIKCLLDGL